METQMILQIVASLATLLLTGFLIPYLKYYSAQKQHQWMAELANIAVDAAQQLFSPEQQEEKKQFAMEYLSQYGIAGNSSYIDALIEASVYKMKNHITIPETENSKE